MGTSGHHLCYPEIIREIIEEARQTDLAWIPANVFIFGDDLDAYPFRKFSDLQDQRHAVSDDDFIAACTHTVTDDPIVLIYTSGTTGIPKGILRSAASFLVAKSKAKPTGRVLGYINKFGDRLINRFKVMDLLPLYHLGGIATLFNTLKASNFSLVMLSRFNPVTAVDIIDNEKCQFLVGTPYMVQSMINVLPANSDKLNVLKGLAFAASAVNEAMIHKILARLKKLSFFMVSYGSSEAGIVANGTCLFSNNTSAWLSLLLNIVTRAGLLSGVIDLKEFSKTPYSVGGRIVKNVEVKIRDAQTGEYLPAGQHGEIIIRSHRVMKYVDDTAVKESFLSDGWYRSGDMGYLDENGLLIVSGRIKRMISRGGEKISPAEVENAILRHTGITNAFVLGVPDQLYGEQICAAIIGAEAANVDIELLKAQFLAELSTFKIPKYFVLLPDIPLSSTGKIATNEVTKLALQKINNGEFYA
jgi:fatty-acyl-CoA synthase